MQIVAEVKTDLPAELAGNFAGVGVAIRRAGSDALRAMRAETVRRIRERRAIKAGAIRDRISLAFPRSDDAPVWRLTVSGAPLRVADYPYRQTKAGVSAQIKATGRSLIRHAFVARMRSGHEGVFVRTGKARLPIEELYTTRVSDVMRDPGLAEDVLEHAAAVFERAFNRNINALIGR
jgi:predicted GNAT family acetyltransferase